MGAGCYGHLVGRDQRCLGHSKRTVRSGPLQDGGAGPALTVGRHDAFTAAGQQSRLLSSGSQKAYLANKVSAVDASESTDQKHCRQNLETQLIHLRPQGWTSQVSWGPALRCSVQLQPAWRVCGMWPLWRSAAPQTHVGVLTPGTSECDRTWRQSLYIGDEVKMRSLGGTPMQYDWRRPRERLGHRRTRREGQAKTEGGTAVREPSRLTPRSWTSRPQNQENVNVSLSHSVYDALKCQPLQTNTLSLWGRTSWRLLTSCDAHRVRHRWPSDRLLPECVVARPGCPRPGFFL